MNEIFVQSLKKDTPPNSSDSEVGVAVKKPRSSNLELYRIICMMMIVAHHYVVNSGLKSDGGPLMTDITSSNSLFLTLLGAWGKTGINCFIMITGYFMCTSKITLKKFLKLMGQIYFYRWIIFVVFLISGYESLSPSRMIKLIMPVWDFTDGFESCFIGFWLTIPFLNILVQNMNKRQHELMLLLLGTFIILGSIPTFHVTFNYVVWFGAIYFIASYFRLYPQPLFECESFWGWLTFLTFLLGCISIIVLRLLMKVNVGASYYFISDSNKVLAVAIAVCSFLWFRSMKIKYSKIINAFGAGTFGVLLIHANSNAMRSWLWKDIVDVVGHYNTMNTGMLALYSVSVVLAIFIICNLIDQLRIATVEKWLFRWYDKNIEDKANIWIKSIIK